MKLDPKQDIKINKFALDDEFENHGEKLIEYGELWSNSIGKKEKTETQVERLKDKIKEEFARLSNLIRFNYKDYGFSKFPTDKAIESAVLTHEAYKEIQNIYWNKREELAEIKREENLHKVFYFSIMGKKDHLEELAKLHLNGYYSNSNKKKSFNKQGLK